MHKKFILILSIFAAHSAHAMGPEEEMEESIRIHSDYARNNLLNNVNWSIDGMLRHDEPRDPIITAIEKRLASGADLNTPLSEAQAHIIGERPADAPLLEVNHHLSQDEKNKLILQLLHRGAKPNVLQLTFKERQSRSPLGIESWYGNVQAVTMLLWYNANPDFGFSLGHAIQSNPSERNITCIKKLLYKANPNASDEHGQTALHQAIQFHNATWWDRKPLRRIINLLLFHGANPRIKNKKENTAIDMARNYDEDNIVSHIENDQIRLIKFFTNLLVSSGIRKDAAHTFAQWRYNWTPK